MTKKISYRHFFAILFIYYVFQTIIKSFYGGVEFDDAEQFLLYQGGMKWIYTNAQPPLYNWLQYLFFKLFDCNILALSMLKHILLFLIFIYTYKLLIVLNVQKNDAVVGSALMFLLPQVSWGCELKLSHSVLLLFVSILTIYNIIKLYYDKSKVNYITFGIIVALGILSKYSYLLLLLSILLSLLIFKDSRKILFNRKIFISILILTILILPHFLEVYAHFNSVATSIYSKVHKSHTIWYAFKSLILAILAFLGPLLLIIVWFAKSCKFKFRDKLFELLTLIVIVNLLLIITSTFVGLFDNFKERWFLPYLFLVPIILIGVVDNQCIKDKKIKIFKIVYFFMALLLLMFLTRLFLPNVVAKIKKGKYSHDAINYSYLKKYINSKNKIIICDNLALCGNIKMIFSDSKVLMNMRKKGDIFISHSRIKGAKELYLPCKYGSDKCLKVYIKEGNK